MVEKLEIIIFRCEKCNKSYKDKSGLWYHNNKYHQINISSENTLDTQPNIVNTKLESTNIICKYCNIELSNRQSRWRHEQKCKNKDLQNSQLITKLKDEIKNELKNEIKQHTLTKNTNNTNNGNIINQKIVINKTGTENIDSLTYNEVSVIFDNEITSVIKLIEHLNFNERKPENHSFCSTALESPYLSFYNTETNTINKERKKYFYEDIICKHIANHEILYSKFKHKFNSTKRKQIEENIYNLKQIRDNSYNNKIMHEIIRKLNLVSYNNRELIQDTWNGKTYENESDEEFMKIILDDPGKKDSDNNSCASSSSDDSSSDDYSLRRRY
jgi:hypothetical protein